MIASVIVVGFNGEPYLKNCLSSVLDQDTPREKYEVIYADNNSADGSARFVKEAYPSVTVIEFERNYGYYEAFNRIGTSVAQGKYLIALPQDTIVHKKWLSELVRVADSESEVMICLANSINPTAPDFENNERVGWVKWVYLMGTAKLGQTTPKRWPFSEEIIPVLAYSGVSALIKRETASFADYLFDPSLSHFLGDVELGIRVDMQQ